jgi:predicted esterase
MVTRSIAATTHGRYLVAAPAHSQGAPILVAFHGYAELAEAALDRTRSIPGADAWILVSIQGLNRFYRSRTQQVIAGWMTSQDRELAIGDNIAYVSSVIDSVAAEWRAGRTLVFTGFSQGVAMVFRAACGSARPVTAVASLGGDIPPELDRQALARIPSVLVGRGLRDDWYTEAKHEADLARLRDAGVSVESVTFDGGHEWTPAFSAIAGSFLKRLQPA